MANLRAKGVVNVSDNGKLSQLRGRLIVGMAGNDSVGALNISGNFPGDRH